MASQNDKGIPLTHAPTGGGYKLLELPPELVDLLESKDAPVLKLESSATAGLLRAGDKTYSLRQRNTSNALILLVPTAAAASSSSASSQPPGAAGQVTPSSQLPEPPGMSAIATVHEMVELVPETTDAVKPAAAAKGKWHEKFGRNR